jgi:cation diffusion facilitator CzcD-associated flavoprotein CzcO
MSPRRIVIVGAGPAGLATAHSRNGKLVGALTHDRDGDYEHARELIAAGDGPP